MAEDKKKRPAWIVPASLIGAVIGTTVLSSVLEGELTGPLGTKGGGLVVVLVLYFAIRAVLSRAYRKRP